MSRDNEFDDLVAGLPAIAKIAGVSIEGVRYLWRQGRIPVVRLGPIWIANKSALVIAAQSDAIRTKRGRKLKSDAAADEAPRFGSATKTTKQPKTKTPTNRKGPSK